MFVLQHDQRTPETSLSFYFGLAKDAGRNPSRAPFSFVLYPHDPAWGMRSAMRALLPALSRELREAADVRGLSELLPTMEHFDPATHQLAEFDQRPQMDRLDDDSDFGEGYKFIWHLHGCYDFHPVPYQVPRCRTTRRCSALLRDMDRAARRRHGHELYADGRDAEEARVWSGGADLYISDTRYWPPHEDYNHTDKPRWGLNFRVNEDPDVSPFLADVSRRKAEAVCRRRRTAGRGTRPSRPTPSKGPLRQLRVRRGIDYRREHFRHHAWCP